MWCRRLGNRSPLPAIVLAFAATAAVRANVRADVVAQAGASRIDPYAGFSTTREIAAGGSERRPSQRGEAGGDGLGS